MKHELTAAPAGEIEPQSPRISKQDRDDYGTSIYQRITQALGDRSQLDDNLDYYNSLYEMEVGPKDWPWPNSANVFIPLIPTQVDTMAARLTATVFPPRLFLVNGNTDEAAKSQHEVERYYNAELARYGWTEKFYQWMHLSLRDGTSIMKVVWKKSKRARKIVRAVPVMDEETGTPVPDPNNPAEPKMTTTVESVIETTFDDVDLIPVELRDFILLPSYQTSIAEASGVAHKLYLDEFQLLGMSRGDDAVLWPDAVKEVLATLQEGADNIPDDPQGTDTLTLNGQINVSGMDGTSVGKVHQKRGPLLVWEVYTDAYDLNGDGVPEENVFWVEDQTQALLGADSYKYWLGKRPFVALAPMPRLRRFYGFSVVERLRTLQEEINALHNQRLDAVDLALGAPMGRTEGATVKDQNKKWGPNAEWIVTSKDDVFFLERPPIPPEAGNEENQLNSYAQGLTGLSAPMTGGTNSGRRTAKEVSTAAASAGVRLDLMAARIRDAMKDVFWLIHHLKLQFGPDEMETSVGASGGRPEKLQLSKAKLAQDYDLSIAGIGGPIDKQGRQQSMLFLYSLLMKNPLVANDKLKIYRATRMLLEEYDRVDVPTLLGTEEQLMEQMKQEQAAQQAQQAAQGQRPGQPPQNGQQPPKPPQPPNGQHPAMAKPGGGGGGPAL